MATKKKHPTRSGSKPFWYNPVTGQQHQTKQSDKDEYFHSILEFKLYNQFLGVLSPYQIYRQQPILYKPATQEYGELHWTIDFVLKLATGKRLYVEAKGGWINHDPIALAEFRHKIQFLEYTNRAVWQNLYLIHDSKISIDKKITTHSPNEFLSHLRGEIVYAAQTICNERV
ncbi:MAG TPA: hypothetical protein V6C65_35615 [Allocoleopsis sp.]